MTTLGTSIAIQGDVQVVDDLTIHGRLDGTVYGEQSAVTIMASADVRGGVIARDITVFGAVTGSLVATEVVDVREGAVVAGRIVSERLILNDGASFNGRVEPQHLAAALKVARHRRGLPDPAPAPPGSATRGTRPIVTFPALTDRLPAR